MERLSLFDTPLSGMNLIEASAGTGKTYTLTGLYIRLILERGLMVEQILVVTYTKAATAELRERIRARMVELRRSYERGEEDPFCRALLIGQPDVAERLQRLKLAILSFDRAAIFTIHGFCQRLLSDSAFEGGLPFQTELLADERQLLQEVVDDFWRRRIQDLPPGLLCYLLNQGVSPARLARDLRGNLNRPYMEIRSQPMPEGLSACQAAFEAAFSSARACWQSQHAEIIGLLRESKGLSRSRYRLASIDNWVLEMERYLQPNPGPRFKALAKFTRSGLAEGVKKGATAPEHPFFDDCELLVERLDALDGCYQQARVALLAELLGYANEQLAARKRQLRVQAYDDLLLNLDAALNGPRGAQLSEAVRRHYGAALIDEFQDTDPIQYAIFRRLFVHEGGSLFLVGDPKQAIYSFRGADIFAYIRAREDATRQYTLDVNWRSVPSLVAAVNSLFQQPQGGFLFSEIPFHPSQPAEQDNPPLTEGGEVHAAFRIGFINGKPNKEQATRIAADWSAGEIARLLRSAGEGKTLLGDRPLAGGDIAVLVRTHKQAEVMRAALQARGIHSVQRAQQEVFKSDQAVELERLLRAVMEPQREGLVFAALAGRLLGLCGERIAGLAEDEAALNRYLEQFQSYHERWLQHGFMRMFRQFMHEQRVVPRILAGPEGERSLTNILHLAELIHQQERQTTVGMEGLIDWFNRLRVEDNPEDEARQLRLESDADLVQIVTIHKSKGLQYPVVFCPFTWDGGVRAIKAGEACRFHDPAVQFRAVLDLGSSQWAAACVHSRHEALAEGLRLLYVALTRARHRCYLTWGQVSGAGESPLAWLLHPPPNAGNGEPLAAMADHFQSLSEADLLGVLQRWAGEDADQRRISECPAPELEPPSQAVDGSASGVVSPVPLHARRFTRRLSRGHAVTSFSALASAHVSAERPDHDAAATVTVEEIDAPAGRSRFSFPRGANPGSCLHAIFEQLDFSNHSAADLRRLVARELTRYGIDSVWQEVVSRWVSDVLDTPLEKGTTRSLRQFPPSACLVEMEFNYPLSQLNADSLRRLLVEHGFASNDTLYQAIERLSFGAVEGFMKGFIDLIVVDRGRYYLIDYKSNWLGNSASDYAPPALASAVARDGYFLQYLLYSVALHRYLSRRLADYSFEQHFGAVYYLFVRGMSPHTGADFGVYRDRPQRALIEALDRYFSQPGGSR